MKSNRRFAGRYAIGIEIGGTKTQVGIGTAEGKLLQATVQRMAVEREQGASAIRRNLTSMVDAALASRRLTLRDIEKVGIGFGGPVDALRRVTLQSFQISGWKKFPLKEWAEKQWRKPVLLENDASTAGLAESRFGNGRGDSRLFYITLGSGVGGGWRWHILGRFRLRRFRRFQVVGELAANVTFQFRCSIARAKSAWALSTPIA